MTDIPSPNADMIRYWSEVNGPRWVTLQDRLDVQLDPLGLAAMERLTLSSGARVLDVGCGGGSTTLELSRRVAPEGSVVGLDVSAPLLACARGRATARGVANVTFTEGDAQTFTFEEGAYDALFSRFGVMFFADPVAAFSNLRRALKPGGAFAFVCWRHQKDNPWVTVPLFAALPFLEPPTPPAPGAPGPFSLADRARVEHVLSSAGFDRVSVEPYDAPLRFGGGGDLDAAADYALQIGPTAMLLREQGSERVDEIRAAVRAALEPHQTPEGVSLGGAMWIVRAVRG